MAFVLLTAAVFAVTVPAQQVSAEKEAYINVRAFVRESGIQKYINASESVQKEYEPQLAEWKSLFARYKSLVKEIEGLQDRMMKPSAGCGDFVKFYEKKIEEAQRLEKDLQSISNDFMKKFEQRNRDVMKPLLSELLTTINEFAKVKEYTIVLDFAYFGGFAAETRNSKTDVTAEFQEFYRTQPAAPLEPR